MGLSDFFRRKPDYVVNDVLFYGGTSQPVSAGAYSDYVEWGSYYLFPMLKMTINDRTDVFWRLRIIGPDGKTLQGKGLERDVTAEYRTRLDRTGNVDLKCPGFGDKIDIPYTKSGCWHWILYDCLGNGSAADGSTKNAGGSNILISKAFYIHSPEDKARENAFMDINDIYFSDKASGPYVPVPEMTLDSLLKYLYAEARYAGIWGSKETDVTLDVEIKRPDGSSGRFTSGVHVNPKGGSFRINGYGNDKGTWFPPGKYAYTISFQGKTLFTKHFQINASPAENCWLEDVEVVLCPFSDGMILDGPRKSVIKESDNYLVWMKAKSLSPEDRMLYLKIVDEDGNLLNLNSDIPEYTAQMLLSPESYCGQVIRSVCSFKFVKNGANIKGVYHYSLWGRNFRDKMVCLFSSKVLID